MRTPRTYLAIGYLIIAAAELALHAYMSYGTSEWASILQANYLKRDTLNGKAYTASVVDVLVPAGLLGILAGAADIRLPLETMWRHVAILAAGVFFLIPLYDTMAQGYPYPLPNTMGKDSAVPILRILCNYLFLSLQMGAFAYFSRRVTRDIRQRRNLKI